MSAIAFFYLLDTSKLHELNRHAQITVTKSFFSKKTTDHFWDYLANNATALKNFDASGYLYIYVLLYLQDVKNIPIMANEYAGIAKEIADKRDSSIFLFTHAQKIAFLPQLQPELFSVKAIQDFNQELSGEGDEETAQFTFAGISLLYDHLAALQHDQQLLLLIIG